MNDTDTMSDWELWDAFAKAQAERDRLDAAMQKRGLWTKPFFEYSIAESVQDEGQIEHPAKLDGSQ